MALNSKNFMNCWKQPLQQVLKKAENCPAKDILCKTLSFSL